MDFYNEKKYSKPMQLEYMLMKPEGYICVQEADPDKNIPAKYEPVYIELGYIDYITDNINFKFATYDEMELTIPKYVQDPMNGFQRKLCPAWEMVRDEYVIEVRSNISDDKQRFVITNPGTKSEETSTRSVEAKSLEYEYHNKALRNFSSKTIDENYMDIDRPWYLRDILNHINTKYMDNTWSVGHIDSNVAVKMRTFDYSDGNIYGFFNELQESFCCVFKFDTINRSIDVHDLTVYPVCPKCHKSDYLVFYDNTLECYNPDCYIDVDEKNAGMFDSDSTMNITDKNGNKRTVLAKNGEKANWLTYLYGRDTGLYLHEKNYIDKFNESGNTDEMATRLYVYGKDGLGINTATENFSGQPYIENFSYYRNDKYMTPELLEALDRYDELYDNCKGEWIALNDEHYNLIRKLSEAKVMSPENKNLLENLQLQINAVKAMTSLQANGFTTETLDELKIKLKDYLNKAQIYVDDEDTISLEELLENLSKDLEGVDKPIVDLANAIKEVTDSIEHEFDIMKQAMENEGLEQYSLEQLEEALRIYDTRIKVLLDISNNIVSADVNSELTTGSVWDTGDRIYYRLILEDTDKGIASETFDNFDTPYVLSTKTNGFFEIELPSNYTAKIRNNAAYILQVWLSKKIADNKYEDRVLQTEDVQYYVLETGNSSGSIYKIRQNNVDLTIIKNSLETAITAKKKVVAEIEQAQAANDEAIATLKLKMAKNTATYTDEDTGEEKLIFTTELILEMNKFIKEQIYTNDAIGVADIIDDTQTDLYKQRVNELYQEGMTVLDMKHTPNIEINVDIVNFMRDIRYQHDWNKISLGDMIHIGHMDASSDDYIVRIIEFNWSNSATKLDIKLSNEDKLQSDEAVVNKFIAKTVSTNATMSVQKEKWNNAQSNAVDEILHQGWNEGLANLYNKTSTKIDDYGITMSNDLTPEKQTRLNGNMLLFTDDNWNTIKTAIKNGDIFAERLVGRMLVGMMAYIAGVKSDGTTATCRIDGDGVTLDNGSLTVKPMDGDNSNKNCIIISPEPDGGIQCIKNDENGNPKYMLKMNGVDGFIIYELDANGNMKELKFNAPIDGNLLTNGIIQAKDIFLGGLNNQSVITYIDKNKGTVKNYTYEEIQNGVDKNGKPIDVDSIFSALQGKHISCAGLNISGSKGSFNIDSNGRVTMNDSDITITDEYGNILIISAARPFTVFNSDNKKTAQLQSNGNLSITGELATGFEGDARIVIDKNGINSYNESNQLDGLVMNPDGFWSSLNLYRDGNMAFSIDVERSGMCYISQKGKTKMSIASDFCTLLNTWNYDGSEIANKNDIANLQAQINALKTNTNPII